MGILEQYQVACLTLFSLMAALVFGFLTTFIRSIAIARIVSWTLVWSLAAVQLYLHRFDPLFAMIFVILSLLYSLKAVVHIETFQKTKHRLSWLQYLAFSIFWPGMRPNLFANFPSQSLGDSNEFLKKGMIRAIFGCILVASSYLALRMYSGQLGLIVFAALALLGLSMLLHFGLFNILVGLLRFFGVRCTTLFNSPGSSRSLQEFWSKRWNLAFSELTTISIYRPIASISSRRKAIWVSFISSGIFHEMAISFPAHGGYGLPTLYFVIHGIGIELENVFFKNSKKLVILHKLWTILFIVLPLPLLFHSYFINRIVLPFIRGIADLGM